MSMSVLTIATVVTVVREVSAEIPYQEIKLNYFSHCSGGSGGNNGSNRSDGSDSSDGSESNNGIDSNYITDYSDSR